MILHVFITHLLNCKEQLSSHEPGNTERDWGIVLPALTDFFVIWWKKIKKIGLC